jgi:hypothetical protein
MVLSLFHLARINILTRAKINIAWRTKRLAWWLELMVVTSPTRVFPLLVNIFKIDIVCGAVEPRQVVVDAPVY